MRPLQLSGNEFLAPSLPQVRRPLLRRSSTPGCDCHQVEALACIPAVGIDDACSRHAVPRTSDPPDIGFFDSLADCRFREADLQRLERMFRTPLDYSERPSSSLTPAVPQFCTTCRPVPGISACENVLMVQVGGGPEPPRSKEKERHDDFYANVGDAIRTLREDVPTLFSKDLNYSIYREDVVFRDPRNCFHGMSNYKLIFWSLRFHGSLFFKHLYVEVKRIWQKSDDTICLRWTVHGFPRLPWDQEGTFDGVSTYRLDSHGKIYEHRVDNTIWRDPPMQRIPLLVKLNLVPVQQPFPSP